MKKHKPITPTSNDEATTESSTLPLARLYMETTEKLSLYAFEASAVQQKTNIIAQQVTANIVQSLFSTIKPSQPETTAGKSS